ncbi:MAG: hypothetical protein ACR2RL_21540 [Gammaproteobacteria bacterium]
MDPELIAHLPDHVRNGYLVANDYEARWRRETRRTCIYFAVAIAVALAPCLLPIAAVSVKYAVLTAMALAYFLGRIWLSRRAATQYYNAYQHFDSQAWEDTKAVMEFNLLRARTE